MLELLFAHWQQCVGVALGCGLSLPKAHKGSLCSPRMGEGMSGRVGIEAALLVQPWMLLFALDRSAVAGACSALWSA